MTLVPVLIAPVVMVVAALVDRRLGPSAAGWTAALPVGFTIAIVAVLVDAGGATAAAMALSAAGHVVAQVAFAIVSTAVLARRGLLVGAAAGTLAYLVCGLGLAHVNDLVAVAAAVPALAFGPRWIDAPPPQAVPSRRWGTVALTCVAAAVLVGGAVLAARLAGPALAGAVGAFPTMSVTLAGAVAARVGPAGAAQVFVGLVRSLPCFLAFCLVVAVLAPAIGLPAVPIALLACLVVARVTWRHVPVAHEPADRRRSPA